MRLLFEHGGVDRAVGRKSPSGLPAISPTRGANRCRTDFTQSETSECSDLTCGEGGEHSEREGTCCPPFAIAAGIRHSNSQIVGFSSAKQSTPHHSAASSIGAGAKSSGKWFIALMTG
ncbi:hypothetical protein F4695_003146 [Rhizobium soli]|uniref:Uncharacterized protein n=1 Tax=Rhizobium soli TaxID=424798 RepID=A0A7X0MSA0_9HYPH|nr:hypothetical protein [Rhizobium soli]